MEDILDLLNNYNKNEINLPLFVARSFDPFASSSNIDDLSEEIRSLKLQEKSFKDSDYQTNKSSVEKLNTINDALSDMKNLKNNFCDEVYSAKIWDAQLYKSFFQLKYCISDQLILSLPDNLDKSNASTSIKRNKKLQVQYTRTLFKYL